MTDISLSDISAGSSGSEAAGQAAEAAVEQAERESTGEWLTKMTELLDDKGLLEPLLFGPDANIQSVESETVDPKDVGGDSGGDLDADQVAQIGKMIIDRFGDVKISKLVMVAEQKPDMVNSLIEQQIGGGNEGGGIESED